MLRINNEIIGHRLCVIPKAKKVQQKKRSFNKEKYAVIAEEVEQLLIAGFIREAHYPEWLSNMVLVKKLSEQLRMWVDFTELKKACPKG